MKRTRSLTDHPMTTGYIEKREYYEELVRNKKSALEKAFQEERKRTFKDVP